MKRGANADEIDDITRRLNATRKTMRALERRLRVLETSVVPTATLVDPVDEDSVTIVRYTLTFEDGTTATVDAARIMPNNTPRFHPWTILNALHRLGKALAYGSHQRAMQHSSETTDRVKDAALRRLLATKLSCGPLRSDTRFLVGPSAVAAFILRVSNERCIVTNTTE